MTVLFECLKDTNEDIRAVVTLTCDEIVSIHLKLSAGHDAMLKGNSLNNTVFRSVETIRNFLTAEGKYE